MHQWSIVQFCMHAIPTDKWNGEFMISALDELRRQSQPLVFADRRPPEECDVNPIFGRADRLIDKLDVLCLRVQLLISNSNSGRSIGGQTEVKCA